MRIILRKIPIACRYRLHLTKKVMTPQANQDAKAKLTALLDAAVDGIIIIDHLGHIELFNSAAETLFGYASDEVIGQNINKLMPQPYREQHDGYLRNYASTLQAKIIGIGREVKARKKNGDTFPIDLSVGEVKNASHKQFVGIIRDITDKVQARNDAIEQRERLAHVTRLSTMGEMAAGIAHEVNQPLTAVSAYAQSCINLLKQSNDQDSQLYQTLTITLDKINQQAIRASDVILRLRGFMQKGTSHREAVTVSKLIYDTLSMAQIDTRLLEHGVTLDIPPDVGEQLVHVDAVQVQQVLLNLLRNGVDAMEQHTESPLQVKACWHDSQYIEVSVIDSGTGIKPQDVAQLFTPFFTTKISGMGMGLSISQSIVLSHQGRLWYEPGLSTGSVFSFTLPAYIAEHGNPL